MLFVDNGAATDPRLNLALEEFLLRHVVEERPLLLFYVNEPAVIIGRNQNTIEEIDPDYVRRQKLHVVRRLSGGGAVYHDHGNLNFSFITGDSRELHHFARFTEPVVRALNRLGVPAELRGTSDLFVEDKKISGNAQFAAGGRMFSHGTLLFDTALEKMLRALNPRQAAIESKAVQSIRNFVTNIRDYLPPNMTLADLKEAILSEIFPGGAVEAFPLDPAAWETVREIAAERYGSWDWNFGRSPRYNMRKSETLPAGKYDVRLEVEKGRIRQVVFYGNFPSSRELMGLTDRLIDVRHDPEALRQALAGVDLAPYLGAITTDQLVNLLY